MVHHHMEITEIERWHGILINSQRFVIMTFFCMLYLPAGLYTPGASSGHENPLPSGYGTCELIYIHAVYIFFVYLVHAYTLG